MGTVTSRSPSSGGVSDANGDAVGAVGIRERGFTGITLALLR